MTSGPIKLTDATGVRFEGEASPAPGGGSMTEEFTVTAAEVAARCDLLNDVAALPIPVSETDGFLGSFTVANDLDSGSYVGLSAYTPGATTQDVSANGDALLADTGLTPATYATYSSLNIIGSDLRVHFLLPGNAAYLMLSNFGAVLPTTGSLTIRLLRAA